MQKKIAYITWGAGFQLTSFQDFSKYVDDLLYLRELEGHDLTDYAAVVLPDGMDYEGIRQYAKPLNEYVRAGGFLIVFACTGVHEWLDVVDLEWQDVEIRDWKWWTRPEPYLEIYQPEPKHPLCEVLSKREMGWHWVGAFDLTDKAQSALNLDDDSGSLFLDFRELEDGGRVIVTTLDPHVHNGERFMPATTKFLEAFYPWLNRELGIVRAMETFVVTYLQCFPDPTDPSEWEPPGLAESFVGTGGTLRYCPQYELTEDVLATTDVLFLPHIHDQIFLRTLQPIFLQFLERGGHFIICSEPAIPWLPFLKPFEAVPSRPFTNLKVRVRDDPFGFFRNMDPDFDGAEGISGLYARGWSEPPDGAIWLTEVGSEDDPKPADWLWQYPTDDGRGGKVVMHNGDNMVRYPDHGEQQCRLVRDICVGLVEHGSTVINRFSERVEWHDGAMRVAWSRALCAAIVVLFLAAAGTVSVLQLRSPEAASADAPADAFSADRAWAHLEEIAKAPHPIGSPEHDRLASYLQAELERLGGTFEVQAAPIPELEGYEIHNLLIRFPGSDPTGTILFATHYDSVPSGPGVGDAGVSVAALVETARALDVGGPLRNDVIVMLSDGEEAGLFGGRAFVDEHPWAAEVDLVFNFEGRGVSGTPAIVEMERPTVDLVSGIFDAAPPLATSPLSDLTLPESYRNRVSDFGELRRLDIQGAHFAVVGESLYYHTPLDDLERSSRETVQHLGETALGLARHFGAADLARVRGGPEATWSVAVPGSGVVAPAWIAWPLLLVAVALAVLIARRARGRSIETSRGVVILGNAIPLLSMMAAALVGATAIWLVATTNGDLRLMLDDLPVSDHRGAGELVNGHLVLWGLVALAAAVVTAGLELARRRLGVSLLVATGMNAWTVGLAVTTLVDPATGAAFAGPFILAAVGTLVWVSRDPEQEVGAGVAGTLALLGAPVVMMAASMTWTGYLGLTLTRAGVLCAGAAVMLGQLLPQLDLVRRVHRWLPTALLGLVAVVLLTMAATAQQTDADLLHFIKTSSVWGPPR